MTKGKGSGWFGDHRRHVLAGKGVSTVLPDGRRLAVNNFVAKGRSMSEQKKRYRKGSFFEVREDYCFVEPHVGSDGKFHCMKRGDICRVAGTYVSDNTLGVQLWFARKDGKTFYDDTTPFYLAGNLRKLSRKNKKDKAKIDRIYFKED